MIELCILAVVEVAESGEGNLMALQRN